MWSSAGISALAPIASLEEAFGFPPTHLLAFDERCDYMVKLSAVGSGLVIQPHRHLTRTA